MDKGFLRQMAHALDEDRSAGVLSWPPPSRLPEPGGAGRTQSPVKIWVKLASSAYPASAISYIFNSYFSLGAAAVQAWADRPSPHSHGSGRANGKAHSNEIQNSESAEARFIFDYRQHKVLCTL